MGRMMSWWRMMLWEDDDVMVEDVVEGVVMVRR